MKKKLLALLLCTVFCLSMSGIACASGLIFSQVGTVNNSGYSAVFYGGSTSLTSTIVCTTANPNKHISKTTSIYAEYVGSTFSGIKTTANGNGNADDTAAVSTSVSCSGTNRFVRAKASYSFSGTSFNSGNKTIE